MAKLYRRPGSPFYWYTIYVNGERVRKSTETGDLRIAEARLADAIKDRNARNGSGSKDLVLWSTFRDEYGPHSAAKPHKTYLRERASIRTLEHYFPRLKYFSEITPKLLDQLKAKMHKDDYGQATINRDIGAIRTMLETGVLWEMTDRKDWDKVKLFKEPKAKPQFWTEQEASEQLYPSCQSTELNGAQTNWLAVAMLGTQIGLRRGEIFHAHKKHVILPRRILAVRPIECGCPDCRRRGKWIPKDYEEREIELGDEVAEFLTALLPKVDNWLIGERPKSMGVMTSFFRKIVRAAGLKGNLKKARHTYASWWVQHGGNIKALQEQMGHSSLQSTMVYAHLAPHSKKESARVMPRVLLAKR